MNQKPKILIINDKPEEYSFLFDFGYEITLMTVNKDLPETLKDSQDNFELILIDLICSYMSGWELLKLLKSNPNFEFTPVLVVTELKDKTDELLAFRSGADDFIKKPFDVDIFLARIDAILRRSLWNNISFVNLRTLPFIKLSREIQQLTMREKTIINLLSKGYSNDDIAQTLCLSKLTVKTHIKNIFKKLKVNNRTEAILVGINSGIIKN